MILRPLRFDCLLSVQHNFYPHRPYFPESSSHSFLLQFVNERNARYGQQKWRDIIVLKSSWHVTWIYMRSLRLSGLPGVIHLFIQTEKFSRNLSIATYGVQKFTHETFKNYWVGSQMSSSMTVSPAFCCSLPDLHTCDFPHMCAIPNTYISPFIPIRHRTVLFLCVNPNRHTTLPLCFDHPRVNTAKPGAAR